MQKSKPKRRRRSSLSDTSSDEEERRRIEKAAEDAEVKEPRETDFILVLEPDLIVMSVDAIPKDANLWLTT